MTAAFYKIGENYTRDYQEALHIAEQTNQGVERRFAEGFEDPKEITLEGLIMLDKAGRTFSS